MATIRSRKLRDGSARYTAQVRVTINGQQYSEAKTFSTKKAAQAWARNRETDLERNGIPTPESGISIAQACAKFLDYLRDTPAGVGRPREQTLAAMSRHPYLSAESLSGATAQTWLNYIKRRLNGTTLPDGRVIGACSGSRLKDDVTYLRTVVNHARKVWGVKVDERAFETAAEMGWDNGMLMISEARDQRYTLDDLDRIMAYWIRPRLGRGAHADTHIPMLLVIPFLIFSTRREAEMCRIRWDDLDRERSRVLVREMKHPRKKRTNDVWVHLPPRAMSIIDKMPREDERIFPYDPRTVGNQFRKARKWAGVTMPKRS